MRVLLVNSHGVDTRVGGAETYVQQLTQDLQEVGHDVALLRSFPGMDPDGVPVWTLYSSDWRENNFLRVWNHLHGAVAPAASRLERAVQAAGPDLVHTHNLAGISTGIWGVSGKLGLPVVHTAHDYQLLCPRVTLMRPDGTPCRPSPLLCGLRNRSLGRHAGAVHHLIAPSQHLLTRHEPLFGETPKSLIRLPIVKPPERRFAPPEGPLRAIGYIGALDTHKGVRELLAAVPALAAKGIRVKIAGRGPLQPDVERADVEYASFVAGAGKEEFLQSCEAGILPSIWDEPGGPPWTPIDWLSAGRPVLVSPRGGLREAIELHGALPVEPTQEGIEAAVSRLLDPQAWREAVASVKRVESLPTRRSWLEDHLRVYEAAAGTG